jgi:formyltetrahydrofolate deformylase
MSTTQPTDNKSVLCISCPDQPGIIAKITSTIKKHGGNLLNAEQFTEIEIKPRWFYMRLEIEHKTIKGHESELEDDIKRLTKNLRGDYKLVKPNTKNNVAILVTKTSHCLNDLLWRLKVGELKMNLKGIISNSKDLKNEFSNNTMPFEVIDIKTQGFTEIHRLCKKWRVDTIVMARFMQIAPPWFCDVYKNKLINIHHSFLPSFIGAKPYHQAKERGVKIIGATCHYATREIDSGPIIEQEVVRVEHYHNVKDMILLGQDCERVALAKGLKLHLENRVFIHGNQTVIFRH